MNTDDLVRKLAHDLEPAAPLRRPAARAGTWFAGAALYIAALAIGMGFVNGYPDGVGAAFWAVQIAAIVASLLASAAAFASVVPGVSNRSRTFAVVAVAVWVVTLAATATVDADWSAISSATHEWWCVGFIVAGGAPLLAVLVWMLRRGAPLNPATTAAFAALSVAALANVGACLSLPHANNAITLAWHGGVIAVATACAVACGRLFFSWPLALKSTTKPKG
jgi:hypothetical protein